MDEKHFKEHLKALAEGHPDEHDWDGQVGAKLTGAPGIRGGDKPGDATAPQPKHKSAAKKPAGKRHKR